MKPLLYYLLQMIIASGILYAYYHFALRNKRFHHYNRFYLLAATAISIVIPFLNIPVYFTQAETNSSFVLQTLTAISPGTTEDPVITATNFPQHITSFSWQTVLYLFYALIAAIVLLRVIISLINIRRIARNNPSEKIDNIRFIKTTEPSTPFSFFRWLFWNRKIELHSEKGEQIFKHELFHIQQKHSWDIMYLEILSVLFWINPFFYLIKKEVKAIHEFLADRFAINENKKWEYAELLLMQVLNTNHHLVNPFFHNQIKRRIAMITTSNKPRHQYLRKLMVLPVASMIILLFAFSYTNRKETGNIQKSSIDTSGIQNSFVIDGTVSMSQGSGTATGPAKITINGKELTVKKLRVDGMDTVKIDSVSFYITGPDSKGMEKPLMVLNSKGINNPLIVLNGMIQNEFDLDKLNFGNIESLTILKGHNAILKYGPVAKNGAIEILTGGTIIPSKKYPDTLLWVKDIYTDTTKPVSKDVKVMDKVEVEPKFPGGTAKWKQFLSTQLKASIPVEKGAPEGVYTVVVMFTVSKEGYVSDVKALTNHGYGMEEEAIRVIKLSTFWAPATDKGKYVNAYKKQPITFQITDEVTDEKKSPVSVELETPDPDILFIGIDNFITVAATGVAIKDLRVSISGGTLTGTHGNYYAKVSTVSDNIILTVADKNGKVHETKKFKARHKPDVKDPKQETRSDQ